jgi:hypothetical protein
MSWLEFIVQMSSAWAWPVVTTGAIVFLRKPIKSAATRLVGRVDDIRHLKAAGVEVDFERQVLELALATKALESEAPKELPAAQPQEVVLPPETAGERLIKYQQLALLDPRAAIILPFSDMERAIRERFHQLYPQERSHLSFARIVDTIHGDGLIDDYAASALKSMSHIRNQAAAEPNARLDVDVANSFVDSVGSLLGYLVLSDFFGKPDKPGTPDEQP